MQKANSFFEHTNAFRLEAEVIDCNLTIQLFDLINWAYFSKKYNESDIGKQIHRKIDLQDIIYSFQLSNQSDQQKMLQKQHIKQYKFGTLITNRETPCYKIQQEGKITIFTIMLDRKNGNKEILCQSILQLNKIRNMTQQQIIRQKQLLQNIQNEKIVNKLVIKYQQLKQENKYLTQQLKITQIQLKNVKQQLEIVKLNLLKNNERMQRLQKQMEKDRQFIKEQYINKQKQVSKIMVENKSRKDIPLKKQISQQNLLDIMLGLQQANSSKFKIQNNQIIFIGSNGNWTQYIFNQLIPYDTTYIFRIKIVKSPKQGIFIGIVDYQKQKQKNNSQGSGNSICYYSYGNNGQTFFPQKNEGVGFKQGQIVEVKVALSVKKILWAVNGIVRAQHNGDILEDKTRKFMPFIQMSYIGDVMEWVAQ